jgi:hypothetical protein
MKNEKILQRNAVSLLRKTAGLFLLLLAGFFQHSIAQVGTTDSTALVALYNSTNGAGWSSSQNWLIGPVASWQGITVTGGRVTEVYLPFNNLSGKLPDQLKKLTALTFLGLPGNAISGKVPASLGNLKSLRNLDLSENNLTGSIPLSIIYLRELKVLNLSRNQLSGTIPASIGLLCNLVTLNLASNKLSGTIPVSIALLQKLTDLFLENNRLTGSIPFSIGFLGNVKQVYLLNNQISGTIPSSVGLLDSLVYFNVANNQLTGSVPASVNNLTRLYLFNIEGNKIENLPNLSGIASLFQLVVSNNKLTFADIEPNISKTLPGSYAPQDSVGTTQVVYVCEGDSLILSADVIEPSPNNSYVWFKSDFSFISESSSSPLLVIPNATIENSGTYLAEISNSNVPDLFLYRKAIYATVTSCAADVVLARSGDTKIYPAPFYNDATIEVTTPRQENLAITIQDANGHVVTTRSGLKTNVKISFGAELKRGFYYITSQHGQKRDVIRVIKK